MGLFDGFLNLFSSSSSSDAPAVPLPEGGTTAVKPKATQAPVMSSTTKQAKVASKAGKASKTVDAKKDSKETENKNVGITDDHGKVTEQTMRRALENYEDTFGVYNADGTMNVQATIDEFNNQRALGLLKEKPRNMKDWSDKRNWDDALKMLANWAPQGPTVLFRGQGGNKVFNRR